MNHTKAQRRSRLRLSALTRTSIAAAILMIFAVVAVAAYMARGGRAERAPLGHDAYIWQRQWTASLDRAVIASASRVRAWRVLAAEVDGRGHVVESSPDLVVLARTARPVIPVIRISGRLSDWDENGLIRQSQTLVRRWRDAGVDVTGVEVDYDCPTSSLRRYASFLATLRQAHEQEHQRQRPSPSPSQSDVRLSITALPSWLDSAYLRDVLQQVDEVVLQVHAVQHPEAGLFDRERARVWAREWSEVGRVPFRIALPTYGSRVTWTRAGRITAIESEARTFADPASGRELFATPLDVMSFIDNLRDEPSSNLAGLVWFRVPTAEDERVWSLDTWHAVMDGAVRSNGRDRDRGGIDIGIKIDATVEPSAEIPGLYDVYLHNRGVVDAMIPERVSITSPGACEAADAIAPYAMEKGRTAIQFRRVSPRLLARDRRTLIGWVRCQTEEIHADAGS